MGNQQGRTVAPEFIAGLIVGEGSFILGAHRVARRKGRLRITPAFYMQMNDRETMEIVGHALEELGLAHWGPKWEEHRGRSVLQVNGMKRLEKFLDFFLPYLTGTKLKSASIAREFIASRMSSQKGSPYTDEELRMVFRLRDTNGISGKHSNRITL